MLLPIMGGCLWATADEGVYSLHVFSLCSLLYVLNSYIFPLVLKFSHTGKWARYVPCKCSHMHWLLSIFQQGLTNVIVSFFRPFFSWHILSAMPESKGESWFPGSSMPTLLPFSFFPPFLRGAQWRLEHEFKASRGAGLLRIFFFPA